jgi:hypothetical protein
MVCWYPDPYEIDSRGRVHAFRFTLRYILRHMQKPVAYGALACGVYSGVECLMEQTRDEYKERTFVNATVAGAAAGMVLGATTRRFDIMASSALGMGVLMGVLELDAHCMAAHAKGHPVGAEPETKTSVNSLKAMYPEYKGL